MHVCGTVRSELNIIAGRGAFWGEGNTGKQREAREGYKPRRGNNVHKFVSIKRVKSMLAPVSCSSLFPWTVFNLWLKQSLTGLSHLLSPDKNPIRPRCQAGLALCSWKSCLRPFNSEHVLCSGTGNGASLLPPLWYQKAAGAARNLLSLRWLENRLLNFSAVSLNDKPYFLYLSTYRQCFYEIEIKPIKLKRQSELCCIDLDNLQKSNLQTDRATVVQLE